MKKMLFIIAITLFLPTTFFAQTKNETQNVFATSYKNVNDFEKILDPKQVQNLNTTLKSSEAKTGHKIIIVTTSSIASYADITDYSVDLVKYLSGTLKIDASILIVISKQLRQIQIRGIDKIRTKISDQEMENIIRSLVVPELKKGDYFKGLETGTNEIIKKLE